MSALDKLAQRYPQKRVLITGATSGMGEALAMQFAAAGFRVAVASRNPAKVAATCEQVKKAGGAPLAITLDVNKVEDFEAAVIQVERGLGRAGYPDQQRRSDYCRQSSRGWRGGVGTIPEH